MMMFPYYERNGTGASLRFFSSYYWKLKKVTMAIPIVNGYTLPLLMQAYKKHSAPTSGCHCIISSSIRLYNYIIYLHLNISNSCVT